MEIIKELNGDTLNVSLCGRLDTSTAPELESVIKSDSAAVKNIAFDFEKLEYISSAGLRILLGTQKLVNSTGGTMTISHVCDDIKEVFDITGFSDILTIL